VTETKQPMAVTRRNTWQRSEVRAALAKSDGFVSAQQLHANLQLNGSTIGLATVYRALSSLVEQDEADTLQSPDGEQLYRSCTSDGHHHHLICRRCGKTVEISAEPIEKWTNEIAAANQFRDVSHVIDIFGTCAECLKAE